MEKPFCILVMDDDVCVVTMLSHALRSALPEALLLTARNVSEAQTLLAEYEIQLFLLDVQVPDGNGIDLLCDIQTTNPSAKCVIMTATPLPEYREQAESLGVLRFMEKPVDVQAICSLAKGLQERKSNHEAEVNSNQFAATLSSLSSIDIIQLKCLGQATQVLEFIAPQGSGRIHFHNGEIVHAETQAAQGETAFHQIVGWRGGRVVEIQNAPEASHTIASPWQSLLLSAAQAIDDDQTLQAAGTSP